MTVQESRREIAGELTSVVKRLNVLALTAYNDGVLSRGEADSLVRAGKVLFHVRECCELEEPRRLRAAA